MTARQTRISFLIAGLALLAGIAAFALTALEDNLVYFRSPSELAATPPIIGQNLRVGGLVKEASLSRRGNESRFVITDGEGEVQVRFVGLLPDLFREGQGVVAEGVFNENQIFIASSVLAKHDENYMPPEVADALKKNGVWKPENIKAKEASGDY